MEKKTRKKFTRGTMTALIIALVLIAAGAIGSFAATGGNPTVKSENYTAWFYMNHLQVHFLENGEDVCGGENTLDGANKIKGELLGQLGYKDGVLGEAEPGMLYKEELGARNSQDIPIYVRMNVKKYWVEVNDDGTAGDKTTVLAPKYIHLTYGDKDYNDDAWILDESVSTTETKTYYYKNELQPDEDTDSLFDSLVIDNKLAEKEKTEESFNEETGVTTYKYIYKYDGYGFMIEADVQAVQTHNANDAIKSQWGVSNVKAEDGTLTVE